MAASVKRDGQEISSPARTVPWDRQGARTIADAAQMIIPRVAPT